MFSNPPKGFLFKNRVTHRESVICRRCNLRKGFEMPLTLLGKLNQLLRDVSSPEGNRLISVCVWSNDVKQVLDFLRHLRDDIQVASADIFVNHVVKYLKSESAP